MKILSFNFKEAINILKEFLTKLNICAFHVSLLFFFHWKRKSTKKL